MNLLSPSVCAFTLLCLVQICGAQPERPNFIFFITDAISMEDTGTYGSPVPTPNMDHLAANGMRFDNAYVQFKPAKQRLYRNESIVDY